MLRTVLLVTLGLLANAKPFLEERGTCCEASCYKAAMSQGNDAYKACSAYQRTTVTPCPTTITKTVNSPFTVTITANGGVKTARANAADDNSVQRYYPKPDVYSGPSQGSKPASPSSSVNPVPAYIAGSCNAADYASACACMSIKPTTISAPQSTVTVTSTKGYTQTTTVCLPQTTSVTSTRTANSTVTTTSTVFTSATANLTSTGTISTTLFFTETATAPVVTIDTSTLTALPLTTTVTTTQTTTATASITTIATDTTTTTSTFTTTATVTAPRAKRDPYAYIFRAEGFNAARAVAAPTTTSCPIATATVYTTTTSTSTRIISTTKTNTGTSRFAATRTATLSITSITTTTPAFTPLATLTPIITATSTVVTTVTITNTATSRTTVTSTASTTVTATTTVQPVGVVCSAQPAAPVVSQSCNNGSTCRTTSYQCTGARNSDECFNPCLNDANCIEGDYNNDGTCYYYDDCCGR